jgi:hypothetical protein
MLAITVRRAKAQQCARLSDPKPGRLKLLMGKRNRGRSSKSLADVLSESIGKAARE